MTRTRPWALVVTAIIGVAIGFLLDLLLASFGLPVLAPPLSLAITVAAAGLLIVALAVPIYRAVRGRQGPVNPFRAMRVVLLAKASSLCGALVLGFGAGIAGFLLTRPVIANDGTLVLAGITAASGLVLLVAGLVAERLCTLPPEDRGPDDDNADR